MLPDRFTVCADYDVARPMGIPQLRAIVNRLGLRVQWVRHDRTRRGWHLVVRLAPALEPAERIALEAILGSDLHRCTLDLMRVIACRRTPIRSPFWRRRAAMLFERKLA